MISANFSYFNPASLYRKIKDSIFNDPGERPSTNLLCEISQTSQELKSHIEAKAIHLSDFFLDRRRNVNIGVDGYKYYDHSSFKSLPKLNFDLSYGIKSFDPRPLDEGLNNILNYILKISEPETPLKAAVHNADFVCFRGTLTEFAQTAYQKKDTGFKFVVLKFQDVFFIMQLDTDAILAERRREAKCKRSKLLTYWGQKFETYIFAAKGQKPDSKSPLSTWNETLASFKMTLDPSPSHTPINLFYCAEVDGLDKDGNKHIEAKTIAGPKVFSKNFISYKSRKWWIQSHFAGIEKIIVGIRNHHGIIKGLEWVKLEDIKHHSRMHWDSNVCMQSVYQILNSIKEIYNENVGMEEMMVIERKPNSKSIHYSKVDVQRYPVLSPEFRKFFDSENFGESWRPAVKKPQLLFVS